MNKNGYPFILFFLVTFNCFSQFEIKLYSGITDYPGASAEILFAKSWGVELGGSYRTKSEQYNWMGTDRVYHHTKMYLNAVVKKFFNSKPKTDGFYTGIYFRYRQYDDYTKNPFDLANETKVFIDTNESVTYAHKSERFAIGILAGYKFVLFKHFIIEINGGGGYCPYYVKTEYMYKQGAVKRPTDDDFLGSFNRISFYAHLSLGYRFGKSD